MLSGQAETHFMMEMIFLGSNVSTKKQVEWADTQCVSPLVVSNSSRPHELQPARLLCPWGSLGKNTGVGSHSLLHLFFPIQRSNLGLLHCWWILYCLNQQGSPRYSEVHVILHSSTNVSPSAPITVWVILDRNLTEAEKNLSLVHQWVSSGVQTKNEWRPH